MERSLVAGLDGCREDSHFLSLALGHALYDLSQERRGRPCGTLASRHQRQADDQAHKRKTDTHRITHLLFSFVDMNSQDQRVANDIRYQARFLGAGSTRT